MDGGDDRRGRYRLVEVIAPGSVATVYRAESAELGTVAIKAYHDTDTGWSERALQSLRRLDHPNIVRVHEWFTDDHGRLCIVQELADGNLDDLLQRVGVLDPARQRALASALLGALGHAHGQGILHRDLKPSNVLLVGDVFKLADFDSGGRLDDATGTTRVGEISGTPRWMSPEQLSGSAQSPASDLFGLGLVLFRAIHGEVPGAEETSYVSLARQRLTEPILVPAGPLEPLLRGCLAVDPADRWPSAGVALAWLTGPPSVEAQASVVASVELDDVVVQATTTGEGPTVGPSSPTPPSRPVTSSPIGSPPPAPAATVGSSRRLIGVVVGAALAVVLLAAALLTLGAVAGWILLGLALLGLGVGAAIVIRRRIPDEDPDTSRRAASIVFGIEDKGDLTSSLYAEAASVVAQLEGPHAGFLGASIHAMIHEFRVSEHSTDRQQALLNALTLMEKVQVRLSPWHVRHRDEVALGVAAVGGAAGLVSAVVGVVDLLT